MKTSAVERTRNRGYRTELRAAIKSLRETADKSEAGKKLKQVNRLLDRAASSGLIHKKNADRNKSRLASLVNRLA